MKISLLFMLLTYHYHGTQCLTFKDIAVDVRDSVLNFVGSKLKFIQDKVMSLMPKPKYAIINDRKRRGKQSFKEKVISTSKRKYEENPYSTHESEHFMSVPRLAKLHGHNVEIHNVITRDGYNLILHRIVTNLSTSVNRTVLLHHGLLGSSADWIMLGQNKSLPYLLCNAGYDVWMTNSRGNRYSRKHEILEANSDIFWNFSWQEMGQIDLPAVLEYVHKKKNNEERISYIGHSMGATVLLVLLSSYPDFNKYLHIGILLAPLALLNDVRGPLKVLSEFEESVVLGVLGRGEFLPERKLPSVFVNKFCNKSNLMCANPLFFIAGLMQTLKSTKDKTFFPRLLQHVPAGGSTNTIMHYAQVLKTGKFHAYNNEAREFFLRNISLPMALFSSNNDRLAVVPDVKRLYVNFKNPVEHITLVDKNISHTEFVWGTHADVLVFDKIMKLLDSNIHNATQSNEI